MNRIFNKVVGTGGIGTGEIYLLEGSHTIGREESRAGHLLPDRDFCKLHIILHYVSILVQDQEREIQVIPLSAVGNDDRGNSLRGMMLNVGMNLSYLKTIEDAPTLHSFCFQYPDGSGGNITESKSACSKVDPEMFRDAFEIIDDKTLMLAVPEVPLKSRIEFIKSAAKKKAFIAASFNSQEIKELERSGVFQHIDLLAVNMDEAKMFSGVKNNKDPRDVVSACIDKLRKINPDLKLTVTDGARGVYAYENGERDFCPALPVKAVNTAGAGDAFLSGLLVGILNGKTIVGEPAHSCLHYALSLAGMSVLSGDTIHFGITSETLEKFIKANTI